MSTRRGTPTKPAAGARRGRPNIVDRERIVDAAVELGLEVGLDALSMTDVAERLGVNRSTLNYHIRNREELVEMVATAVFEFDMDPGWMPGDKARWQEWVRASANALRGFLLAHEHLALYFKFSPGPAAGELAPVDMFFGKLFAAGFSAADVSKATTYIAQVVFMCVRDELMSRRSGRHPQDDEMAAALEQVPPNEMPYLRRFMAAGGRADPEDQFAFDLDCVVAGLEAHLTRKRRRRR